MGSSLTPLSGMSSDGSQYSPSSPSNAAMAALRRWRPPAKGGSPLDDIDLPPPCGLHERAMLVACLGSCAAGTTLSYTSAAMPFIELEPWYQLQRTTPANRWVANVLLLGATGGALLSGILLPLTGHRRTLLMSAFGLVCAWICLISSNSVAMLLVSRVARGLWLGALACCASLYVTNVPPPKKRAFFGGMIEHVDSRRKERTGQLARRGVASIVTLVLSYSLGLCHLPPLLTGELVPLRMRYLGSAVIWATRWIVMFLMAHLEDSLLAVMQTRQTFLAFCLVYVLTTCITIALIPETGGRSLMDIAKDE
ncbi:uncharacterized protein [Dermacentor albipictus]